MGAIVRRRTCEYAVVIVRESLSLHQGLLATGRAACEVGSARGIAIECVNEGLGKSGHQMGGAPSKIFPFLWMPHQRIGVDPRCGRGPHIGIRSGKTSVDAIGQFAEEEATGITAVARAEIASVVVFCRHPD